MGFVAPTGRWSEIVIGFACCPGIVFRRRSNLQQILPGRCEACPSS